MRFDDSLQTVLSAEAAQGYGAQATWRQLVDLIGRGRVADAAPAIARLRLLRPVVPVAVRAASARALALAGPPARLVDFFAEDDLAVAAPVLRMATLPDAAWLDLLPRLTPPQRALLRHRRDLPEQVRRGLESFGAVDFVLDDRRPPLGESQVAEMGRAPAESAPTEVPPADDADVPAGPAAPQAPLSDTPFKTLGSIAGGIPLVAEALQRDDAAAARPATGYAIPDLVARIDAFRRNRDAANAAADEPAAVAVSATPAEAFRWETDASGLVRWVDGVSRGPLIGVSLEHAAAQGLAQLDGVATGAFRRRTAFHDARLEVGGTSDAAGSWRLAGVPGFDERSGRFTGFRGTARRPRRDETATPTPASSQVADSLRQLVHELRTPTNAIAGFAELIETELLGAVADAYRRQAAAIRAQASDLLAAIDDLDIASRIDGHALELRPRDIDLTPLLERTAADLLPLARLRRAQIAVKAADVVVHADDRQLERLLSRLLAAVVSAAGAGETITIEIVPAESNVAIMIDRPHALVLDGTVRIPPIDAEREAEGGGSLLGTGFALRLAQNLAGEMGGRLAFEAERLVLLLPGAATGVDRAAVP